MFERPNLIGVTGPIGVFEADFSNVVHSLLVWYFYFPRSAIQCEFRKMGDHRGEICCSFFSKCVHCVKEAGPLTLFVIANDKKFPPIQGVWGYFRGMEW